MPRAQRALRTLAEAGCAAVGLFFCVATSAENEAPQEPLPEEPWWDSDTDGEPPMATFDAEVFLHNGTTEARTIRIRSLSDQTDVDCDVLDEAPGRLLTSPLFGEVEAWTLEAGANMPLDDLLPTRFSCKTAILSVDGMADVLLFWHDSQFARINVPATGATGVSGELALRAGAGGELRLEGGRGEIVYGLEADGGPAEPTCGLGVPGDRLVWADPMPIGQVTLTEIDVGLDGCFAIDVAGAAISGPWFLCVPADLFPFDVGDVVTIAETWASGGRGISVESVEDSRGLWLSSSPESVAVATSVELEPNVDCGYAVASGCGTVGQPTTVWMELGESMVKLTAGEQAETLVEGAVVRAYVAVAQTIAAVRSDCGEGADALGTEASMAVANFGEMTQ